MLVFSLYHNPRGRRQTRQRASQSVNHSFSQIERRFGFHRNCGAALVGEWKRMFGFINSLATSSERIQIELSSLLI